MPGRRIWPFLISLLLSACGTPSVVLPTAVPTSLPIPSAVPFGTPDVPLLPSQPPPGGAWEFSTDFSRHTVPYDEIFAGGPPKDGIPAIDRPQFVSVSAANEWIEPQEPVVVVQIGAEARAYPIQILMWHEIVNDTIADVPVAVTFCPLCNTAIIFDRRFDGQTLDFGTTGRLRYSNLIMYDRQTETWWQQATGAAIAGKYAGARLQLLPGAMIAWETFASTYPEGQTLSRDTGILRDYGRNPYTGYDDVNNPPFLYSGPETPGALPATARVLTIDLNGEAVAYPYDILAAQGAVNDSIGNQPVLVLWQPGTSSALDAALVSGGRDVGAAAAFSRVLDGRPLTLVRDGERLVDTETRSTWNILGQATDGPLAGQSLTPIVAINHFWFSWAAL